MVIIVIFNLIIVLHFGLKKKKKNEVEHPINLIKYAFIRWYTYAGMMMMMVCAINASYVVCD